MQLLIITFCSFLSCLKVTIQGNLAKGDIKNTTDSVLANCLVFASTAVLFSISARGGINTGIIFYALAFGILSASFQIFYALALKSGPFSATCMLVNLSMVIPVVFSVIFINEKLTVVKIIGVILCLLALFLNTHKDGKKFNFKWLFYVLMAFSSTGGISVTQKIFAKSQFAGEVKQFVFLGYLIAFLVTFILVFVQKGMKLERNFKINKKNLLLVFSIAGSLGLFQYFNTYANSFIDAIVLNPSISGLATMFQMFSARIIFKEKFTVKQICSICIGIVAIIMISI
ncbi:MAG: hypothetical protein E7398_03305 [Ruminococcaceae bacterium]|nr:hypothetical protein [Oscillospiraceae bacterium]